MKKKATTFAMTKLALLCIVWSGTRNIHHSRTAATLALCTCIVIPKAIDLGLVSLVWEEILVIIREERLTIPLR